MSADIVPFPDEWTPEQQEQDLLDLHQRLSQALLLGPDPTVQLSIDDIMQLCELIEQRLGPDWFDDEPG